MQTLWEGPQKIRSEREDILKFDNESIDLVKKEVEELGRILGPSKQNFEGHFSDISQFLALCSTAVEEHGKTLLEMEQELETTVKNLEQSKQELEQKKVELAGLTA